MGDEIVVCVGLVFVFGGYVFECWVDDFVVDLVVG